MFFHSSFLIHEKVYFPPIPAFENTKCKSPNFDKVEFISSFYLHVSKYPSERNENLNQKNLLTEIHVV